MHEAVLYSMGAGGLACRRRDCGRRRRCNLSACQATPPRASWTQRLDAFLSGPRGPVADPNAVVGLTQPEDRAPVREEGHHVAAFAGGCFWHLQRELDGTPGVRHTRCGYTQGTVQRPSYKAVCSGRSGHVEAVRVEYDPSEVAYGQLLDVWWACVEDPTDGRGQGADRGRQYRLGVYWYSPEQRDAALAFLDRMAAADAHGGVPLAVEVKPAAAFHEAEEWHQGYFLKGGLDPCPETPFWMGQFVDP